MFGFSVIYIECEYGCFKMTEVFDCLANNALILCCHIYFIFIKICLIDICLLLSECGLHYPNIADQCLLQSASIQTVID